VCHFLDEGVSLNICIPLVCLSLCVSLSVCVSQSSNRPSMLCYFSRSLLNGDEKGT